MAIVHIAEANMNKTSCYQQFLSTQFKNYLLGQSKPVEGIKDLKEIGSLKGLETKESLSFLVKLYNETHNELEKVLVQRKTDREFIDTRTKALSKFNQRFNNSYKSQEYETVIGLKDADDRVVIGPLNNKYHLKNGKDVAKIPKHLEGNHITLFGPPDNAKMCINAMNCYHRQLDNEPQIVRDLLAKQNNKPKWGADDEDSKTPLREDLANSGANLTACFKKEISFEKYKLQDQMLANPIKRFPGLALPCTFLFYQNEPLPLHLYDFALHFFANWNNEEALTFYVPKLESEEEARYIKNMLETAEHLLKEIHPDYKMGSIRLMIVLENPRAVFRVNEIMDELYPYFAGASLGWHDYLASTARLFKEDSQYKIPVKADPNIVIKYIKASHELLADVVGPRGGIKVGGMYGVLPITTDLTSDSFQITLRGYFRDIITQLKRDLTGFWVAHPDFVRLGLAIVEAWKQHKEGQGQGLQTLVKELLNKKYQDEILKFIAASDIESLDKENPLYPRALLASDNNEPSYIANNHPDEIRYNIFQSLQYITDWLSGNGCVALPSQIDETPIRVMDDLATAERSRWEVWHELYHGRFPLDEFLKITFEEYNFIRRDLSNEKKIVQVKWTEENEKWYPIALKLMIKLMTDKNPVEFATELLLPFTDPNIRNNKEPWRKINEICTEKYKLDSYIKRFIYYFEYCGQKEFADKMARGSICELTEVEKAIKDFNKNQIIEAASFHGDIGQSKEGLDKNAMEEQRKVLEENSEVKDSLIKLAQQYHQKFGMKFLVAAKGKNSEELLKILKQRISNSEQTEINNAREALWQITQMRIKQNPIDNFLIEAEELLKKFNINKAQISITSAGDIQTLNFGSKEGKYFEIASLSKTIASAFAINYFQEKKIELNSSVNQLLTQYQSSFKLEGDYADEVQLTHLMNHTALNMHYVNGIPSNKQMPKVEELLKGNKEYGYEKVKVQNKPGQVFQYSGGGFLVLEYLIELIEKKSIHEVMKPFLSQLKMNHTHFNHNTNEVVTGYKDNGKAIDSGHLNFPLFAAGTFSTTHDICLFLNQLTHSFHQAEGNSAISHDTAVQMLHGIDKGCMKFMGSKMGLGVFVAETGDNKLAIHQGANDGFRTLYLHCYDGPDKGKGLSLFCNAELNGVLFNSFIAQKIIKLLKFEGIDTTKFKENFSTENLSQEEIVNIGYKELIFDAFIPSLPEENEYSDIKNEYSDINLALDAEIIEISNQKFARAENLISPMTPVFIPTLFGKQGKIMDSWETVRHNPDEYDYLTLKLNRPSTIATVSFCTKYHNGNHVPEVRLLSFLNNEWVEILPKTKLDGHALKYVELQSQEAHSLLKIEAHPDGGLSRLGLYKELKPPFESKRYDEEIPTTTKPLSLPTTLHKKKFAKGEDIACRVFGSSIESVSNEHYGPAEQVISEYPPLNMFDGMESARSRDEGHFEEVIVKFFKPSQIKKVHLDFEFFVNNNPLEVQLEGIKNNKEYPLTQKIKVKAFAGNKKIISIDSQETFEKLKVKVFPDGGINRIHVYAD